MIGDLTELQREILDILVRNIALARRLSAVISTYGIQTEKAKENISKMILDMSIELDGLFKKAKSEWYIDKPRYTDKQLNILVKMLEKV